MTAHERAERLSAILAKRAANGMRDPLNRLRAHTARLRAAGFVYVAEVTRRP